jgi:hypothetical protein
MNRFTDILNNLVELVTTSNKLYAIVIVGSQARKDRSFVDIICVIILFIFLPFLWQNKP